MKIIPTILEKQFSEAEEKIRLIKDQFKWIQIDVVDGYFSYGKTFELERLGGRSEIKMDNNLLEIHLMVNEPIKWIEKCNFVGAARVIGQVEMMKNQDDFVTEVKNVGMEAGLAFDIDTEVKEIPEETDLVLLMGRKSGFEPQQLNEKIYEKIEKLSQLRKEKDLSFMIGIDGGINENNILKIKEVGADITYCGAAIFDGNVNDNISELKNIIE